MLAEDDDLYLVMEYVDGETLSQVLRSAPLEPERVLELLAPVADALDHAHAHEVVHRDVKPSNILVGTSGIVKLADLGLATAAEITRITPPDRSSARPRTWRRSRRGRCRAPAVDVYALATIAFEGLSGTLRGTGRPRWVLRQASEPVPDVRAQADAEPRGAAVALVRGLAPAVDASARCATVRDASSPSSGRPSARRAPGASRRGAARASRRNRSARALALLALRRGRRGRRPSPPSAGAGPAGGDARAAAEPDRRRRGAPPEPTPRRRRRRVALRRPPRPSRRFARRGGLTSGAGAWRCRWSGSGQPRRVRAPAVARSQRIEFERAGGRRASGRLGHRRGQLGRHAHGPRRPLLGNLRTVRSGGRWLVEPAGLGSASGAAGGVCERRCGSAARSSGCRPVRRGPSRSTRRPASATKRRLSALVSTRRYGP